MFEFVWLIFPTSMSVNLYFHKIILIYCVDIEKYERKFKFKGLDCNFIKYKGFVKNKKQKQTQDWYSIIFFFILIG